MQPSKWGTYKVRATSTTEVLQAIAGKPGYQAVIRALNAVGLHASSLLRLFIPQAHLRVRTTDDIASTAVLLYVPVDVAAGHIVQGHTMTTNDFVILPSSTGLVVRAITGVNDHAGEDYCSLDIGTVTDVPAKLTEITIVRAADITSITVGAASIVRENVAAAPVGMPLAITADSGDATNTDVTATIEWIRSE